MLTHIGLKRVHVDAFLRKTAEALLSQAEFFDILNQQGASGLLAEYIERGVLVPFKPPRAEMDFARMARQKYHTPNSLFFTFCSGDVPQIDIKSWRLSIEGDGVAKPFSIGYDELLKLPVTTVTRYLDCAGNGRTLFASLLNRPATGPQWHLGGYGIADWSGVRLSEVLKRAQIKPDALDVMPVGIDGGQRPMPVVKAVEDDTLLAYIMNGEILPPDHGFPLRALVPGWVGVSSVKWVNKITVSTQPLHVAANTTSYVLIGPEYAPQPPAKGSVITTQLVKSACCLPWPATLKAGHRRIFGYAWSPFGKIAGVEVSLDGGKTFRAARLTGPNIERAGTRWEFHFDAKPGEMTITPLALDEKGNTQYDVSKQQWNRLGYLWGAATPHPVTILDQHEDEDESEHESEVAMSGCC